MSGNKSSITELLAMASETPDKTALRLEFERKQKEIFDAFFPYLGGIDDLINQPPKGADK